MTPLRFRAWFPSCNEMAGTENWLYIGQNGHIFDGSPCNHGLVPLGKEDCIIMQSTGLKDKNGKEIFCDDIIKFEGEEEYGVVKWCEDHWGYKLHWPKHSIHYKNDGHEHPWAGWLEEDERIPFEIAGNTYENPELLTK